MSQHPERTHIELCGGGFGEVSVTLHFERGGSVASCMMYTGHKNYKELETYRKKTLQHKLKVAKQVNQPRFRKVI